MPPYFRENGIQCFELVHSETASVRPGLDQPVAPKQQINIVSQSDEKTEQ